MRTIAERTLAVRQQESEKCGEIIERHVQEFQSWMGRAQGLNFSPVPAAAGAMCSEEVLVSVRSLVRSIERKRREQTG